MVGWQFNDSGDDDKLVEIMDWGPLRFVSDDTNLFKGCSNLTLSTTSDPPFNADVSGMFQDCSSLTGTGGNIMYWDMSSVTGMNFMLAGCTNLDVDLSNWDVSSIKNAEGFMAGAGLSTMNYDRILSGWSSQPVQSGVNISFGDTKYSVQSGELYRNALLSSGWVITDGGRPPIGFISTWNTTFTDGGGYPEATASTANDTVSLPLTSNGVYDFGVDWGDGSQDQITSYNQSEVTHQYSSTGIYTISITGGITGWRFAGGGDDDKITNISRWGPLAINSDYAFYGCSQLEISTTDSLKLITPSSFFQSTRFLNHFGGTKSMTGCDLSSWDISEITTLKGLFTNAGNFNDSGYFDADLGNWDVSHVTDISWLANRTKFTNGGSTSITGWDTSSVTGMQYSFAGQYLVWGTGFNQPIGSWDVSNVKDFGGMFDMNQFFDQDLSDWDISSATDIAAMFGGHWQAPNAFNPEGYRTRFNNGGQTGIGAWDTSNVVDMNSMFLGNTGFNQPIGNWDTSNVTNMSMMFTSATAFNQPIGSWDVSNIQGFYRTFENASAFDQNIGSWNVTSIIGGMQDFMVGVTLSVANYDALLNGWGPQNVKSNVNVNFGNSQYSSSSSYWRNHLINSHGWTITDGGQV